LDKSVRIWDTQTGVLVERTEGEQGHKDSVYSVAFSPDGRHLVSGSLDKTIKMWELNNGGFYNRAGVQPKSGKCIKTFEGHKDFVLSVALTPDGQWVMSGSKDRGVQFWDPATGQAQLMLQGHKNSGMSKSKLLKIIEYLLIKLNSHLRRTLTSRRLVRHRFRRHEG
jgi:glucose repression regulatory protein TUP1